MSAVKRLMESLDELDDLRESLLRQGADASDVLSIEDYVDVLRGALGIPSRDALVDCE